jgi:hypothetical protein
MKSNARVIFISETGKLDNYQPVPIQKRAIAERKVDLSQLRCVPGEESARFKVLGGQGRRGGASKITAINWLVTAF